MIQALAMVCLVPHAPTHKKGKYAITVVVLLFAVFYCLHD